MSTKLACAWPDCAAYYCDCANFDRVKDIRFTKGRRYIKAYKEYAGSRSAVAFFDTRAGYWLEAESWTKPSKRISGLAHALDMLRIASGKEEK